MAQPVVGEMEMRGVANLATLLTPWWLFPFKKRPNLTFFPFKKAVSENCRYCRVSARSCCPLPARAHTPLSLSVSLSLCVCVSSVQRAADSWGAALSVKHGYYIASLVLYDTRIAEITALILSSSYVYLISLDDGSIVRIFVQINILEGRVGYVNSS